MSEVAPDRVFAALSDPTRATIVEWLGEGGAGTATEIADQLPISRQAVTRHLKQLEGAGLIAGKKRGREVRYALEPDQLAVTAEWLRKRAASWEQTLQRLANHLD